MAVETRVIPASIGRWSTMSCPKWTTRFRASSVATERDAVRSPPYGHDREHRRRGAAVGVVIGRGRVRLDRVGRHDVANLGACHPETLEAELLDLGAHEVIPVVDRRWR